MHAKSLIQNKAVTLVNPSARSDVKLLQSHCDWTLRSKSRPLRVHDRCVWLILQGSSLKWDGSSTTQISKWKSCLKKKPRRWRMWYVFGLRTSTNRAVLTLTPSHFYQHGNDFIRRSSCLHSDSKCLLDGDKCLLGWDSGQTHNSQQYHMVSEMCNLVYLLSYCLRSCNVNVTSCCLRVCPISRKSMLRFLKQPVS